MYLSQVLQRFCRRECGTCLGSTVDWESRRTRKIEVSTSLKLYYGMCELWRTPEAVVATRVPASFFHVLDLHS